MSTFLKWEDPSRGQRGLSQDPALKKARVKLIITPWKQTPAELGLSLSSLPSLDSLPLCWPLHPCPP